MKCAVFLSYLWKTIKNKNIAYTQAKPFSVKDTFCLDLMWKLWKWAIQILNHYYSFQMGGTLGGGGGKPVIESNATLYSNLLQFVKESA